MRDFPGRAPRPLHPPAPACPPAAWLLPARRGSSAALLKSSLPPRHKANRHYLPLPLPRAAKPSRKCPYLPRAASPPAACPRCPVPKAVCAMPRGCTPEKGSRCWFKELQVSGYRRKLSPCEAQHPPVPGRLCGNSSPCRASGGSGGSPGAGWGSGTRSLTRGGVRWPCAWLARAGAVPAAPEGWGQPGGALRSRGRGQQGAILHAPGPARHAAVRGAGCDLAL